MAQLPGKDRPAVSLSQLTACRLYMHSNSPTPANAMHYKESGQINLAGHFLILMISSEKVDEDIVITR
jgi:hypothetical protein